MKKSKHSNKKKGPVLSKRDNKSNKKAPVLSIEEQVVVRFARMLQEHGHSLEWLPHVEKAWMVFCMRENPQIRSVEGYAAALDYAFVEFFLEIPRSQTQIAAMYGTTVATLNRIAKRMMECWQQVGEEVLGDEDDDDDDDDDDDGDESGGMYGSATGAELRSEDLIPPEVLEKLRSLPQSQEHWTGGRRNLGIYIQTPYPRRPDMVMWADMSGRPVVYQNIVEPDIDDTVALTTLVQAMLSPIVGAPRRPKQISVNHPSWVEWLRTCLKPLQIEVRLGGEKVVDAIVTLMESHLHYGEGERTAPTFTQNGKIPVEDLERFFEASAKLYDLKPWRVMSESQVVQVSLRRWGFEDATLAVIGGGDEIHGILLFHSAADCWLFRSFAQDPDKMSSMIDKLPRMHMLTLNFERGGDLEPSLRQDVFKHGWKVANPNAYPVVLSVDDWRYKKPVVVEDYWVMTAIAHALTVFVEQRGDVFGKASRKATQIRVDWPAGMEGPPMVVTYPDPGYVEIIRRIRD